MFVATLATAVVTTRLGAISPLHRRVLEAALVAGTMLAMTYSPWGKRSGAHYNPAVTLTFLALGRMGRSDAACYIAAQAVGALIGIAAAALVTGGIPALAPFVGVFAACLVFLFICVEAPLSGFSMNPARSLASALSAGVWAGFWIYVLAPPAGMLAAALVNRNLPDLPCTRCAKVQGSPRQCCIHCGYEPNPTTSAQGILRRRERLSEVGGRVLAFRPVWPSLGIVLYIEPCN